MELFSLWLCLYSSNTRRTCLHCRLWGDTEIQHLSWGSSWLPRVVWPFPGPTFWKQVSSHLEKCRKSLGCQKCCSPLAWKVKLHSCVLKRSSTVWSIPSHVYHFSAAGLLWHEHIFLKWAVKTGKCENLFKSSDLKNIRSSYSYFYWILKLKFPSGIILTEETEVSIRAKNKYLQYVNFDLYYRLFRL